MDEFIDDIQIIMIELPKWRKIGKFDLNNPKDRWLMYFTNPHAFDRLTQEERAKYDEIYEALESVEAKNFSPERLYAYELYIDNIRQYVTTMESERQEGRVEGVNQSLSISINIIDALKHNQESPEKIALRFNAPLELVMRLKSMI
jgi:predicted transposase/invertase (TIGR01784 family)